MASIPDEFLCPITLSLMTDPVIGSDGRTYERSAILQWLAKNQNSPMTREPMTVASLKPNYALKSAIERFEKSRVPKKKSLAAPKQPLIQPVEPVHQTQEVYYTIQVYQDSPVSNPQNDQRKRIAMTALCILIIVILIILLSRVVFN